jgi:hypothetical protein
LTSLGATHVIDRNLGTSSLLNAIKQVLPDDSTSFLFDTVSSPDTLTIGFELLAIGGQMIYVIPNAVIQPKDGQEAILVNGNPHFPVNKEMATALYENLGQLLGNGDIKVGLNVMTLFS